MSFDALPDLLTATAATEYSGAAPRSVTVSPLVPAPARVPHHPTERELAALVTELYAEGTLSLEQLRALGRTPELQPHLGPAIDATPALRRAAGSRP